MSKDYTEVEDLLSESDYNEEYNEEIQYVESFSYKSLFKSSIFMLIINAIVSTLAFFIIRPRFGKPLSIGFNTLVLTILYALLSIFNIV